jgi:hypothetical protein
VAGVARMTGRFHPSHIVPCGHRRVNLTMPAPLSTLHGRPHDRPRMTRANVDRYSFIAMDLHHLLLAGLPAHLALTPLRNIVVLGQGGRDDPKFQVPMQEILT